MNSQVSFYDKILHWIKKLGILRILFSESYNEKLLQNIKCAKNVNSKIVRVQVCT